MIGLAFGPLVLTLNIICVVVLARWGSAKATSMRAVLDQIIANPLILACAVGDLLAPVVQFAAKTFRCLAVDRIIPLDQLDDQPAPVGGGMVAEIRFQIGHRLFDHFVQGERKAALFRAVGDRQHTRLQFGRAFTATPATSTSSQWRLWL